MSFKFKLAAVSAVVTAAALVASVAASVASTAAAPSWCGSKKITLALSDGFGGNTWRRITEAEARDEASKCPAVTKFIYTDGQGNTQKAISDINGLVAQGVNALIVFADAAKGIGRVLKKYPGIHLVGQQPFGVTTGDPALTQKAVPALLAKYPKTDGITAD